ncbi:hypothetical protein BJAS_P3987 [Bathymodiolus japonicus methanotrophic gill symbiont]|nr:hypothetical protein BJAS_P3987 [Bathymodiolus japonicus methanotrophic gill symbiont]
MKPLYAILGIIISLTTLNGCMGFSDRKAAEQGNAGAQYSLALMYKKGKGVVQDDKEAFKWFRKSAEQGNGEAQFLLGRMYVKGEGVVQDDKEAVKWYRKAAEQGHANAQNNLGVMYATGEGVVQDYVMAHKYFNIAASSGVKSAHKNRDIVTKLMTVSQIEKAQNLASEWMKTHAENQ